MSELNRGNRGADPAYGFLHLKLVSKVAILTSLMAGVSLIVIIWILTQQGGTTYAQIIHSHSITRQHLGPAMFLAGLFLISFVGFITWLIALYSSFRVAGPLYRFSQNLELAVGRQRLLGIRSDDCLQDVSQELVSSVDELRHHYDAIGELADRAYRQMESPDDEVKDEYARAVTDLKGLVGRVRIDQ